MLKPLKLKKDEGSQEMSSGARAVARLCVTGIKLAMTADVHRGAALQLSFA